MAAKKKKSTTSTKKGSSQSKGTKSTAKKGSKSPQQKKTQKKSQEDSEQESQEGTETKEESVHKPNEIPKEINQFPENEQKKVKAHEKNLMTFRDKVIDKFSPYVKGVAVLPPPKEVKEEDKDKVHTLVLVDDTDSMKMSKEELKDKLNNIISDVATEVDQKIKPQPVILSELWQSCFDSKYDMLQLIAMSASIYDSGMLAALKIGEIHKSMVIKKFEKYIISYVLAGSLTQGKAKPESDVDVWVVIDDTDVKKMTRAELKDKLRSIIIGMGSEAGEATGIKNKLNVQVYILSEFWDNLKEANPVIFTLLRDGVPFYDRGMFMPWKQLLKMGRIKPSSEAIDMFRSSGDQMIKRVHSKMKEIGMEDTFWAILTPSQAALMLYGLPPPTPAETPEHLRDIFVKKEKLLEEKYVKILEKNIQIRKDLEHGTRTELSGKEVDDLVKNAQDYLERLKTLFTSIEDKKQKEGVIHVYDTVVTIIRDVLKMEGIERVSDVEIVKYFEDELISQGKIPAKYLRILNEVLQAKKDYDENKLSKSEVDKVNKSSRELINFLVEYMQRKRAKELQRVKIQVKHGSRYGEVVILGNEAFIFHDIDSEEKEVSRGSVKEDGSIVEVQKSSMEEFEKALANVEIPKHVLIKEKMFEHLKDIFGRDVEILLTN